MGFVKKPSYQLIISDGGTATGELTDPGIQIWFKLTQCILFTHQLWEVTEK